MISRYTNKFCIIHGHYALVVVVGHWWVSIKAKVQVQGLVSGNNGCK